MRGSLEYRAAGLSAGTADGRFVRRYVGATLAAETRNQITAFDTSAILSAPVSVHGRLSELISPSLMDISCGGRFGNAVLVYDNGSPIIGAVRYAGTVDTPTQITAGTRVGDFSAFAYDGSAPVLIGRMTWTPSVNVTTTAKDGKLSFAVGRGSSLPTVFGMTSSASGISALTAEQASARLVPQGTWQGRNVANTGNVIEWGADTLGFYNVAPIARPTITGSRGGNAALASLLTQGALLGLWINSTT